MKKFFKLLFLITFFVMFLLLLKSFKSNIRDMKHDIQVLKGVVFFEDLSDAEKAEYIKMDLEDSING